MLGLAVLVGCGLVVGWRWHGSGGDALLAVGLLLLLRFAVVWVGVYLGLLAKNPEAVTAVQVLVWPLGFLSNVFVATATMPGWLGTIAQWNPLSATISATRELFGNPRGGRRRVVDRAALAGDGDRVAAGDRRGPPPPVGAPLPTAAPLT